MGRQDGGADRPRHIALYLQAMDAGGVEFVFATLSGCFARRGHRVTLVLDQAVGPNLAHVPAAVRVVELGARRLRQAPLRLARFIRRERPDVLMSGQDMSNVVAVIAGRLAGRPRRIVASIHDLFSARLRIAPTWQERSLKWIGPWAYRRADLVIAVSDAVADDLAAATGVPRTRIRRIYNPVPGDILDRARQPLEDPLFRPGAPPVVIGIGRLAPEKGFDTLIRAFALLRQRRAARLLILGEGTLRGELEALAAALGVADSVALPGFVANPYPYLLRSAAFVLSSTREGFSVVIVEALACGTPVVSTDCPGGPPEILGRGRHGRLVPVGDAAAMADAIAATLQHPPDPAPLRRRAAEFELEAAVSAYLAALLGAAAAP
jgi:glycosyltransferase involved in cell wall biosynthesis